MAGKTIHGQSRTKTYSVWRAMKRRCTNPNAFAYHRYGGRGIEVCERWHTFENFFADVGEIPAGMTLDRVDNDGDYTPENIRFATRKEQSRNMACTRRIEYEGAIRTIREWSELTGLPYETIYRRLCEGWTTDKVLSHEDFTKGHVRSEETLQKMREASTGRTLSLETRRKVSEALRGRPVSEETRRKISEANRGHAVSEETRRKISETKRRKASPEN